MTSKIIVIMRGWQRGLYATIADALRTDCDVTVVANASTAEQMVTRFPELGDLIEVDSIEPVEIPEDQLVSECLKREERYGEFFSMIASYDRALGKGYLVNVENHPDIGRSWWPQSKKLRVLLEEFMFYERLLEKIKPDLVISAHNGKILSLVARHHGATPLSIIGGRFGQRYLWANDEYLQSSALKLNLSIHLNTPVREIDLSGVQYMETAIATARYRELDYSYRAATRKAVRRIAKGLISQAWALASRIRHRRRSSAPRTGYHPLGWVPPILRRAHHYKIFTRAGVTPKDLVGKRIIYFPLHMEPEATLLSMTPEFNNSMELITWVSKAIPADTVLVVKENPFSFGVRSGNFYNNLRRIGNVALAEPHGHSWEWIQAADVVTTITGTAGYEAVFFDKPILSFGKHQVINGLPTARFAHDYSSTREGITALLAMPSNDPAFDLAKYALHKAQLDVSFELPNYEHTAYGVDPEPEMGQNAVAAIRRQFPDLFLQA